VRSLGLAANVTTSGVDNVVPSVSVAALLAVPLAALVGGYFAAELALRRSVRRRLQRISSELPTVFEFLSLCLAAGESITDSLNRVARVGSGDFAAELAQVARQVGTGVPLASALSQLSSRLQLPPVTRGVEQILGALDRGSPLAAVLAAQAQDAREDSKRELLEKAGQKEVVMLIPLVFLILPVTILFAVFPGLMVIQAGF
jgi:tight adherence protein C